MWHAAFSDTVRGAGLYVFSSASVWSSPPLAFPAVPTLRSATLPLRLLLPGVSMLAGHRAIDFDAVWHVWVFLHFQSVGVKTPTAWCTSRSSCAYSCNMWCSFTLSHDLYISKTCGCYACAASHGHFCLFPAYADGLWPINSGKSGEGFSRYLTQGRLSNCDQSVKRSLGMRNQGWIAPWTWSLAPLFSGVFSPQIILMCREERSVERVFS